MLQQILLKDDIVYNKMLLMSLNVDITSDSYDVSL